MEERDVMMAGDWSIVPLTEETSTWKLFNDNFSKERWEIQYEHLIMAEVIGQGAFGVVRRAKIPRKKLQPSTLKFLDKSGQRNYIHRSDADKEGEMETVAVKMLKGKLYNTFKAFAGFCDRIVKSFFAKLSGEYGSVILS